MGGNSNKMGLSDSVFLIIGACIGSAIFSISGITLHIAGPASILSWIFAAIIFCAYGVVLSKLAILYPGSGGIYIFPKRAIGGGAGRILGFASGWGYIISNLIAIAFSAVFAGKYFCAGFPALAQGEYADLIISIISVLFSLLMVLRGGRRSQTVQNILVAVLVITMLLYCGTSFFSGHFEVDNFEKFFSSGVSGRSGFISAVPLAMVAYGGCVVIAFMASEVRNPERNIPRSLFLGLGSVSLLYALVITAIVGTLPLNVLRENESLRFIPLFATISDGTLKEYGWLSRIISICSFAALTTTIMALLRVNARAIQAMSHEGFFPDSFSRENSRGVLTLPFVVMTAIVLALCFKPQWAQFLITLGAVLNIVSMTITCVSLMVSNSERKHRATTVLALLVIIRLWLCFVPEIMKGGGSLWLFTAIVYAVGAIFYVTGLGKARRRLHGVVVHGKGHGHLHGMPTANLQPFEGQKLPREGVWAVKVFLNGREYRGMTNVGLRPSDDDSPEVTVETRILDFEGDIYGSHMTIEFMKYIRPTQKFADLDALKVQIDRDIKSIPLTFAIVCALFLTIAGNFSAAAQPPKPAKPQGEMLSLDIKGSEIYPGTQRNVKIYVPTQYDGKTPACLFVRMDGLGHNLPVLFDELIASGEMPVTIGLFITPGTVFDENGNVLRYNRSNEFDRMTGTWAEFIETEVIPKVEELKTSDGRAIKISRKAADRAINGDSSGGIAAFTAAWQRPDLYSRVYSIVGTFVPMRGGDGYPALIRKTEPKPLRIFIQDNDKDTWNLVFGSWYEYNLLMASALQYAGYDLKTQWNEGAHSGANGGAIMKDVLRWLWKGWPEAPAAGKTGNALISSLIIPGEGWQETDKMEGNPSHEAVYPGNTYVARPKEHSASIRTWLYDKDGQEQYGEEFYWLHSEGADFDSEPYLAFDTEGWLYASTPMGIQVCDQNGRVRGIITCPAGKLKEFSFVGNRLYIRVGDRIYTRLVGHNASTKDSPAPKSQGMG